MVTLLAALRVHTFMENPLDYSLHTNSDLWISPQRWSSQYALSVLNNYISVYLRRDIKVFKHSKH